MSCAQRRVVLAVLCLGMLHSATDQSAAPPCPSSASHCRYILEPTHHEMLIIEDLTQDMRQVVMSCWLPKGYF